MGNVQWGLWKIAECRVQPVYSAEELNEISATSKESKEKEVTISDAIEVNDDSTNQDISLENKSRNEDIHLKAVENFMWSILGTSVCSQ